MEDLLNTVEGTSEEMSTSEERVDINTLEEGVGLDGCWGGGGEGSLGTFAGGREMTESAWVVQDGHNLDAPELVIDG